VTFAVAFPKLPDLERPVVMLEIPGQNRMLVALQDGRVVSFEKSASADSVETVLDNTDKTSRGGNEEGLLGMTLDPDFERNGYVYLYYNLRPGERRTQISRFESSGTGADFRMDAESELPLLTVPQPFANHNGGQLSFGPDGMLYLGLGDGGSQRDPSGNGQDLTRNLLGSIIRIDVRGATAARPYQIPPDNPFADGRGGAKPETWAYGLRNPWRFSWDPVTGGMISADVGQNEWKRSLIEEGKNYGWNIMEGRSASALRPDVTRRA
jgi:glucose/arabinose dehydrogenase